MAYLRSGMNVAGLMEVGRGVRPVSLVDLWAEGLKVVGGVEEGDFVVTRFALHSGLRQGGGVFDAGLYLGLRPRL